MLTLTIDQKPAVLKAGTSFKLTRENPYFTDSGDYTLDVELPLAGCPENLRIFGAMHRPETGLTAAVDRKLPFRLLAPPLDVAGHARVTSRTEEAVKVQLVAGASGLRHAIEDAEEYVDKLDLGTAWDDFPEPEHDFGDGVSGISASNPGETASYAWHLATSGDANLRDRARRLLHGVPGEASCVCFPIWSEEDGDMANPMSFTQAGGGEYTVAAPCESSSLQSPGALYWHLYPLAPQPWLLEMVRRVVEAAGYRFRSAGELRGTWMEGIFIANARCSLRLRDTLPHWTLPEFISEVQNLLGCVFTVDGQDVTLRRRSAFYGAAARPVELREVADGFSADLDEDGAQKTSSAGNVGYAFPDDLPMLRLPDEVWERATVRSFATQAQLEAFFAGLASDERARSEYLLRCEADGRAYAILRRADTGTYVLHRVDHYGPLLRQPGRRAELTELRIVPVRMRRLSPVEYGQGKGHHFTGVFPTPWLYAPCTSDTLLAPRGYYSVDEAINPQDDDGGGTDSDDDSGGSGDGRDVMEVAWWNGDILQDNTSPGTPEPSPVGIPYADVDTTPQVDTGLPEPIALLRDQWPEGTTLPDGPFSLATALAGTIGRDALSGAARIDTRCQHVFRFTDRGAFDPMVTYLVRGRRYACLKLEYTIDENGAQPLKTGYFYEIEES